GADGLIIARSKGLPLKAFAVIYKINPVCAYSIKESGITNPQDFIGKNIGLQRGTNTETLYYAMMEKLDINRSQINELTIGYDATELLNGITDVSTGYLINEPHQVIEAGYEVNTILTADYGVNMYADVLFATEDTINNNPELVEKFLRATLDGWQYAINHRDEAVNITLKYATDRTNSHETYMLENSIPLINAGDSPIGWMEESKWEQVQDVLLEQNITDAEINIEDVYTMDFLEKIYGET
ncbi:MAG: ABC transporter substrate-binding protein, partial [Candidatus Thermoplasmatota archaeon]|nr:ABC transporter substrate-binding protein [Candidatus Thermoplasmatota archaeon]